MSKNYKFTKAEINDALLEAIKAESIKLVKMCISYDADVNIFEGYPLCTVCNCNNYELAKLLLENGADACSMENNPIAFAVRHENIKLIDLLLQYGASDYIGVLRAISVGKLNILQHFINKGFDLKNREDIDADFLVNAVLSKNIKLVEFLIQQRNWTTQQKECAIFMAYNFKFFNMLELFKKYEWNINIEKTNLTGKAATMLNFEIALGKLVSEKLNKPISTSIKLEEVTTNEKESSE